MAERKDYEVSAPANETRTDRLWYEGQPPSSVNNAARENEAISARDYRDNNGSLTSTGAAGNYTVTINSTYTALFDGLTLTFTANHAAPGASTLTLNAPAPLPQTAIVGNDGSPIEAGQIPQNSIVMAVYKAAGNHFRVTSSIPVGVGSIGTNEIADKAVTDAKLADGPTGAVRTYDASGRPGTVRGADNQVLVRRSGVWVAESMPGDEYVEFIIPDLSPIDGFQDLTLLGLSQAPDELNVYVECIVEDNGYFPGEQIEVAALPRIQTSGQSGGNQIIQRGGITITLNGTFVDYNIKSQVWIINKKSGASGNALIDDAVDNRWRLVIGARVYAASLPPGGGGTGTVNNAFSTVFVGAGSFSASGEDILRFSSSDGSLGILLDAPNNRLDLTVNAAGDAAGKDEPYVVWQAPTDLPNAQTFTSTADTWLATKTTDDLAPSATRLYVTRAEKDQWSAGEPNLVDSVFGLTGDVLIGSLTLESSPPDDGLIPMEKSDGSSWNIRVDSLTGGAVTAAYASMAGDTGTAVAVGSDAFKIMGADNKVTVAAVNDDPTDGDAARITINEANILLQNLGGALASDAQHGSLSGGALHASANATTAGFESAVHFQRVENVPDDTNARLVPLDAHVASQSNPHNVTPAQINAVAKTGTVSANQISFWSSDTPPVITGISGFEWTSTQFVTNNFTFGHDQNVSSVQDRYVLQYVRDNQSIPGNHEIVLQPIDLQYSIGDLPVTQLNGGTNAGPTTVWHGDGTWRVPSGGGGGGGFGLSGIGPMPASIPAGASVPVVCTVTGANPVTDSVVTIHVPSTDTRIDRYGVVTANDEATITLTNTGTSEITGLSGNVTVYTSSSSSVSAPPITDHGQLDAASLLDDDHTQYHNDARGDVRYYTRAQSDATFEPVFAKNTGFNKNFGTIADSVCEGNDGRLSDARTPLAHTHTLTDVTDSGTAAALDAGVAIGDLVQLENVGGTAGLPAVDGSQLTNLPSAGAQGQIIVDSIADLRDPADPANIAAGDVTVYGDLVIWLAGYTDTNDGGEGNFVWDPNSTDADNGGTIIAHTPANPGRWIRPTASNAIKVKWFGAKGDGTTDDTAILQSFFDYCQVNHRIGVLNAGIYRITDTVWLTGQPTFTVYQSLKIVGELYGYDLNNPVTPGGSEAATTIFADFLDKPAVAIQGARGVYLGHLGILGGNTAIDIPSFTDPSDDPADYVSAGCRDSQYSPYCGIAIDPTVGPIPPDGGYPGLTYDTNAGGSANVTLDHVNVRQFVVGIMVSPPDVARQGDNVHINNPNIKQCHIGVAFGQSQTRGCRIIGGNIQHCRIGVSGIDYGQQLGSMPAMFNSQVLNVYWIIRASSGSHFTAYGLDCESFKTVALFGIGLSASTRPMAFYGGRFRIRTDWPTRHPYFIEAYTSVVFAGCEILNTEDIPVLNFGGGGRESSIKFESCYFNLSRTDNRMFIGNGYDLGLGRGANCYFRNCKIDRYSELGSGVYDDFGEYTFLMANRLNVTERAFMTHDRKGHYLIERGAENNRIRPDSISNITFGASTVSFDTTVPSVYQIGDILYWEINPVAPAVTLGRVPSLEVSAINGSNITCDFVYGANHYNQSYAPSGMDFPVQEWAPTVSLTGDVTTGSPDIINVSPTNIIRVGDWILGSSGIPNNTRVTAIAGSTVTLSNNANATAVGVSLYFSRLYTFQTTPLV